MLLQSAPHKMKKRKMKIEKPLQHNLAEDVQGSKKVSFIGESCS